ncbi:beta-ketoacyl-[acyl-carrier-protein] synthase family protein [Actinoplanes regularis]|uniref:3-oxoacyl-[acyl-carrier-protein] synthase II n=1 Tax=Actinoplanes regularis TaxID=52697 RepID=A0A239I4K8_9ACTN|nr:beta-ketoacyl-[acyl-carrier-protein] synthase family protein [Actinoplanes regularis]GIE91362.1 3-oxoacyl-[acyl-carrier-protein] synthase 2 [Actinoplanes regularis]SNS88421.1 3-oxoacyl-[acyl-carrier-protein] synthase II [Actinoplanes regularis]
MSARDAVAVTGIGLVTPAGVGAAATWAGLCAGRSMATTDPELAGLAVDISCPVTGFDGVALLGARLNRRLDPFSRFAVAAAREAVAEAGLGPEQWAAERVGVVLGVGGNSMGGTEVAIQKIQAGEPERVSAFALPRSLPNMAAAEAALDLGTQGPCFTVSSACASSTHAIGVARDLLLSGACDVVITGGTETARSRTASACFGRIGALSNRVDEPHLASRPFDLDRDGFVLGEGAGVLVMERVADARARGARIQAYLSGFGASSDAHHVTAPHPEGRGAIQAIRAALADAGLEPADIGHVNAHATSTPMNDVTEGWAISEVFGRSALPVTAFKGVIGHAMGAAGAIEAAGVVLSLRHGLLPPVANLDKLDPAIDLDVVTGRPRQVNRAPAVSTSFGFGGQNAALVFSPA